MLKQAAPDFVHIVTEGPLGLAARIWLSSNNIPYTSAYHTRFPEYLHNHFPFISLQFGYNLVRRFHSRSQAVFVPTPSMRDELARAGFVNLKLWTRGVEAEQFHPDMRSHGESLLPNLPRPWFTYVGRVAPEKNLAAFLKLKLPGTKIVVGDGPQRAVLQEKYRDVHFAGYQKGPNLAGCFAAADVFVFPSRTDTFGVVLLEAMASGTPVAAFPVTGPKDVVAEGKTGFLDEDLSRAAQNALQLKREDCRQHALQFTWGRATDMLLDNLAPIAADRFAAARGALPKAAIWQLGGLAAQAAGLAQRS